MVESCVSEDLSAEEQQIYDQLEFLGNDFHPDAHACRLKLSAVTCLGRWYRNNSEPVEYARLHQFENLFCLEFLPSRYRQCLHSVYEVNEWQIGTDFVLWDKAENYLKCSAIRSYVNHLVYR